MTNPVGWPLPTAEATDVGWRPIVDWASAVGRVPVSRETSGPSGGSNAATPDRDGAQPIPVDGGPSEGVASEGTTSEDRSHPEDGAGAPARPVQSRPAAHVRADPGTTAYQNLDGDSTGEHTGGVPAAELRAAEDALPDPPDPIQTGDEPDGLGVPGVLTAADVASAGPEVVDESATPLAQSAHHRIAVATGRPLQQRLPKPATTRVMVVANQKGGVGKTTSAVNMAAALAQHGLRILVIDLDPQGNASTALGIEHSEGTTSSYEVLTADLPLRAVIVGCRDVPGLYAVPATIDLAGAEMDLFSMVSRENRLRRAVDVLLADTGSDPFDYIFIDCPPSLGLLTVNALTAAREVLIPIQCEYYALEGLSQLLRTVDQIREFLNPQLRLGAILLTMYDARTRLASGVADEVREHFADAVLPTAIPRSVRISEAPSYAQTVLTYDPGSPGALCYLEAARELAERNPEESS